MDFSFNPYERPGEIVIHAEGHASFIAENFHQAETFVQQLTSSDQPILLGGSLHDLPILLHWARSGAVVSEPRAEGDTQHSYTLPSIP